LKPTKNITAKSNESTNSVEITIRQAQGASGPVGISYVLSDMYDDEPVLEKYTMGGFVGRVKVATFACYTGND